MKHDSPLHTYLSHYHVTAGLPTDIAHDLLENIVPYEKALCFKRFYVNSLYSQLALKIRKEKEKENPLTISVVAKLLERVVPAKILS